MSFDERGSMGSEIATLLQNPKYRSINLGLVIQAVQDRIDDYYQWCTSYECTDPDSEDEYRTYEYFKGYGRALELALEILAVINRAFTGPYRPICG